MITEAKIDGKRRRLVAKGWREVQIGEPCVEYPSGRVGEVLAVSKTGMVTACFRDADGVLTTLGVDFPTPRLLFLGGELRKLHEMEDCRFEPGPSPEPGNGWPEIKGAFLKAARPTHPWEPTIRLLVEADGVVMEAQKDRAVQRSVITWACLEEAVSPAQVLETVRVESLNEVNELFKRHNR